MTAISDKYICLINKYHDKELNIHEKIALEAMKIKSRNFKNFFDNETEFLNLISLSVKRVKRRLNRIYRQESPLA